MSIISGKKAQLATTGGVSLIHFMAFSIFKRTIRAKSLGGLGFHVNLANGLRTKNDPLKRADRLLMASHKRKMAGQVGLEPTTCGFGDRRSANWSYWPVLDTLLFISQSCLCGSEACQGNTIRAAGDIVKTDLIAEFN